MKGELKEMASAEAETARSAEMKFQEAINLLNEISRKDGYDIISAIGSTMEGGGPDEHSKWGNIAKNLSEVQKYLRGKVIEE